MHDLPIPVWIGIYSNIINGLTYAVGSIGVLVILSRRDIGHRLMIGLFGVFSMLRMVVCFTVAWDSYHSQVSETTSLFRLTSSIVGLAFLMYVLMRMKDIIKTLTESEYLDRLRTDERADHAQARLQQTFLSAQTLKRSEQLLAVHPSAR